ncbi:hypothetical protein [Streptomyces avicenniae]|uniref:hypothetical protein n=1 Tax=Streptomyces avicenniae TaxID=500153 RepID=UPI000699BE28|nr:hypothetical protein [Streptomyces avicenniae]
MSRNRSRVLGLVAGAAAGAAGTTALNTVTYADMALRGRPASSTPEATVEKLAGDAHVTIPGDEGTRPNRFTGLGALTGLAAGVGAGALLGAWRAAGWRPGTVLCGATAALAALVASNGPMTLLRVTDPRTWSASDWVSDVVPHAAYGAVTAWLLERLDPA